MEGVVDAIGLGGLLAVMAVLGAVLGAAAGHWRGGSGRMVSGAIMGAIALPLAALAFLLHVGVMVAGAVIVAALAVFGGVLG